MDTHPTGRGEDGSAERSFRSLGRLGLGCAAFSADWRLLSSMIRLSARDSFSTAFSRTEPGESEDLKESAEDEAPRETPLKMPLALATPCLARNWLTPRRSTWLLLSFVSTRLQFPYRSSRSSAFLLHAAAPLGAAEAVEAAVEAAAAAANAMQRLNADHPHASGSFNPSLFYSHSSVKQDDSTMYVSPSYMGMHNYSTCDCACM